MKTQQISLDTYISQMQPHIDYAIKDGRNQARIAGSRGVLLSRDDLAQEARIVLMKTYKRYARKLSTEDLGKVGTRSIRNRVQDLCRSMDSVKVGGVGEHVRRGRQATARYPEMQFFPILTLTSDQEESEPEGAVFTLHDSAPSPLENAAIKAALTKLVASLSEIEQRAVRSLFERSEFEAAPPLKGAAFAKLKDRVRQTIREAV